MNVGRLILATFVLFVVAAGAAAWDSEWIDQFGTPSEESANGVAIDATGVYVGGEVFGALPGQIGVGSFDAYVRKYDFSGQVLWTRQFGSLAAEFGLNVAADSTGAYIAGFTAGALPGQANAGSLDVFVRKFSADGTAAWTTQFGTSGRDLPLLKGIVSHSSGIYVVGDTSGTFPGEPTGVGRDAFLANLDSATGGVRWVRQFGIRDSGLLSPLGGVSVDDTGVSVVTNRLLPGDQSLFAVLRKYDFSGQELWRVELPATSECFASFRAVAAHAGNVYAIGQWSDAYVTDGVRCRPPSPGSTTVGVLQAYDGGGALLWTRVIKGGTRTGHDAFTGGKNVWASEAGIFVGANLTTSFPGYVSSGSSSDRRECRGLETGNPFADKLDAYVRWYDFNGDVVWTHQFGSSVFDLVNGVVTDATGAYVVGDTSCRIAPDQTYLGGPRDAFILRMTLLPTSLAGLIQLVVGRLETLNDAGQFTPGDFNSLVKDLEAALSAIERGDAPLARQALETFIGDVERQHTRGTLSSVDAARLIDGATAVIAKL